MNSYIIQNQSCVIQATTTSCFIPTHPSPHSSPLLVLYVFLISHILYHYSKKIVGQFYAKNNIILWKITTAKVYYV